MSGGREFVAVEDECSNRLIANSLNLRSIVGRGQLFQNDCKLANELGILKQLLLKRRFG